MVITGDVEDIKAAYAALDVVLMVSELPEAFSGVVIEGMAMGKPVIGTDAGGTAEQIVERETGLLIPPGDPQSIAEAIDALLSNPTDAARMGRNARRVFLEEFELEGFYRRIMEVYQYRMKNQEP
jgi:glycosyltransferase involved in cell wall biosynthesis